MIPKEEATPKYKVGDHLYDHKDRLVQVQEVDERHYNEDSWVYRVTRENKGWDTWGVWRAEDRLHPMTTQDRLARIETALGLD